MNDQQKPLDRPDDRGAGGVTDPIPADDQHRRQDGPIAGRDPESQQAPDAEEEETPER